MQMIQANLIYYILGKIDFYEPLQKKKTLILVQDGGKERIYFLVRPVSRVSDVSCKQIECDDEFHSNKESKNAPRPGHS